MKRKVLILFILALVTLVIVGWLGRNAINRSIRSVEQASVPNQKLLLIREVFQELLDAESSVRTYTITDNRDALNSFGRAASNVDSKLTKLELASNNESQQRILLKLDSLIDKKFETLRRLIRIKDAEPDSTILDRVRADIENLRQKDASEQLSTIRDLYLEEENSEEDYERLFGNTRETDSVNTSSRQDLNSTQLEEVLTQLSNRENKQKQERLKQEMQLTGYDNRIMDEIRNVVGEFESLEARISQNEANELKNASQDAKQFITTIMAVGLVLFALMLLIIFRDISKSIRNREQLRAAKEEAERLARVKEEFLSNMSHEIRTPLNAVIGFTEQLSSSRLSIDQSKHVERIQRSGKHLQQLINDILDYAKLESGKLSLEKIGFSPEQHLHDTLELLENQAREKGLELQAETTGKVPEVVMGDPVRFSQVIINLVNNAIKFTKEGHVAVRLSQRSLTSKRVVITLQVEDTGVGIPEDKLKYIFEDFAQADSSTTREFGGTGLGLSIVQKIVKAHKGQLDVKSEPGSGTTFTVSLPFTIGTKEDLPELPTSLKKTTLIGRKILVVDDQEFNRELVETILTRLGAEVRTCGDGLTSIDILKSDIFDLVLMDIQMPGISGLDTAKKIRSSISRDVPVIALTAGSSEQEKKAVYDAGMDDILLKPFRQADLERIIQKYISSRSDDVHLVPDISDLVSLANGDETFVINMLKIFIDNNKVDFAHLREACDEMDHHKIRSLAHKMIPPCRHLGLEEIVGQLKTLEAAAIEKDEATVRETIGSLKEDLKLLYPEVEKELRKLSGKQARSSV